jgi:hypothetical protein
MRNRILSAIGWLFTLGLVFVLSRSLWRSFERLPTGAPDRIAAVRKQLDYLGQTLRNGTAISRMDGFFPEGGCFTVTLYALAWTNLADLAPSDADLRRTALAETEYALSLYTGRKMRGSFNAKQAPVGAFFRGQKNLVLGRYLELRGQQGRTGARADEFHLYSREMADVFMKSPTHHMDSYPDMCWPADNITALASLVLHDQLYGTNYRAAYEAWKSWTLAHPDPGTGMPAGHLDSKTGELLEPARGCANSWIIAQTARFDRPFASSQYLLYKKAFGLQRLGFRMFREYPEGCSLSADVDSGPVIWGAGMVATAVGLGTARAMGDLQVEADIHSLALLLGWPQSSGAGECYLLGSLPVADAFLAWARSVPESPERITPEPTAGRELQERLPLVGIVALMIVLLLYRATRALRRKAKPVAAD